MSVWHPAASIVTRQPLRCSSSSKRGMASTSFDPSVVPTWPRTTPFAVLQALTIVMNPPPLAFSNARRKTFPSIAITPSFVAAATPRIHLANMASSGSGSSFASTRPMVSCEGIPDGNSTKPSRKSRREFPNRSTATGSFAPHTTPHRHRNSTDSKLCRRVRVIRGSGTSESNSMNESTSGAGPIEAWIFGLRFAPLVAVAIRRKRSRLPASMQITPQPIGIAKS